jgi:hypothetical protein
MVIKNVRVVRSGNTTSLTATCKLRKVGWDDIYFSVDGKQGDYIFEDASPFAAALLIPSMKLGQDLIIHGTISKKLHDGLQKVMDEVLTWNIGLKRIKVRADNMVADTHKPTRTASFFSGGVDSFYTFLKHQKDEDKSRRVDSFFIFKGWDVDPRNEKLWQEAYGNVKEVADAEGIEVVVIRSNIHALLNPIIIEDWTHGGYLGAIALALRGAYGTAYVPSSFSMEEMVPWGSHINVDPNFSTEKLRVEHDGVEATRLEKVLWEVAKSPLALAHLRVCYMNKKGVFNCGRCDKCLRTMTSLYIAGVLENASTFPHDIDLAAIAAAPVDRGKDKKIFHAENQHIEMLRKNNLDPKLLAAIEANVANTVGRQSSLKGTLFKKYIALERGVLYLDYSYLRGNVHKAVAGVVGRKY